MDDHPGDTDISDRSLLRSIIQTAPDAIITIDAEGSILTFSPAAERMFGYSEDEITGQNVSVLMPEPHRSNHDGYIRHYLVTGEKRVIGIGRELRAQRRSGEVFIAELAVGEIASGRQTLFTGFLRDVTDRVQAQRRAVRLQRTLERMNRSLLLGEMSSALAHELNQPLTAMSNFANAARRTLDAQDADIAKARKFLSEATTQAQRAGQIMHGMIRLVERGQCEPVPDDINAIVREAVRSLLGPDDPDPTIMLDLTDDLPDVLADRIQIQQVVINLINNAIEARAETEDHDVHIETALWQGPPIQLRARPANSDEVMVTVSDGGPGLPDEIADRLFEPFVTGKEDGLGAGLAVCRTIIAAHGGRIWAENGPDGGAEFHFTLPVAHSDR